MRVRGRWWRWRPDPDRPHDEHLRALAWLSANDVLGQVPGTPDWRRPLADAAGHDEEQPEHEEPRLSCRGVNEADLA